MSIVANLALFRRTTILLLLCGAFSVATARGAENPLSKAEQMIAARNYQGAAIELNALLRGGKIPPGKGARLYYMLAGCYYGVGQSAQAEKLYASVVTAYPGSVEASLAAEMLQRMGKSVPAVATKAGTISGAAPTQQDAGSDSPKKRSGPVHYTFDEAGNSQIPDSPYDKLPERTRVYYKEEAGGHMRVEGFVNNRPISMWFDTGAAGHFGKNDLAAAGIQPPQGPPDGYTSGWAGKPIAAWHMVADVRLGDLSRRIPITVEETSSIPPLIGTDLTRGYEVEIDRTAHCLNLKRATIAGKQQLDSMYDLPCKTEGHDVIVKLGVGRGECDAIIDTGASNTIISAASAQKMGIEIPADAPTMMFTGVGGSTPTRQVCVDLRIGPIRQQGFPVFVGGMGVNAIGQDMMSGWRFRVDRDKHLVRFFH